MIAKLLAAALLAVAPATASAPDAPASPIPLVLCGAAKGFYSGTAFRIGPKLLVSVAHLTNLRICYIDGRQIKVIYTAPKQDFSLIADERAGPFLPIDCGGYVKGRRYIALGHPRATNQIVPVELVALGEADDMAVLTGIFTAQPGHSGGPVIDAETHKVVGTINAADWEGGYTVSLPLKNTSICKGSSR